MMMAANKISADSSCGSYGLIGASGYGRDGKNNGGVALLGGLLPKQEHGQYPPLFLPQPFHAYPATTRRMPQSALHDEALELRRKIKKCFPATHNVPEHLCKYQTTQLRDRQNRIGMALS